MSWLSTARILYFVMNSTFQNTHHSCSSSSLSQHPPTPNLYPQKPSCDNYTGFPWNCYCEEGETKITVSFNLYELKSGSYEVRNSGGDLLMESNSTGSKPKNTCYNGCGGLTIFSSGDKEYLSYLAVSMIYPDGSKWSRRFDNSTRSFGHPGPAPLSCPPLTLADYSAMTIGARDPLLADNAIGDADGVMTNACKIGAAGDGVVAANDQLLSCGFAYSTSKTDGSTLWGSTIIAEIREGECATVAADAVEIPETVGDEFISTGNGTRTSVIPSIAMEFTSDEKNGEGEAVEKTTEAGVTKTVITQSYCARADVWDDVDTTASVLAYMMQVETKTTFDNNGDFSTDVTTTEFTAEGAAAAASRSIPVFASFGECVGETSAALKELKQENAIAIGDVLDVCVFVDYDVDIDVQIAKVKSFEIKDGDNVITSPIDGGETNFVTTAEQNAEAVKISTLMIPKIYDTLDGPSSFTISGVAELTYTADTRRLSFGERRLQSEEAPFSLKVDLSKNDLPQVAMNEEESGAMSAGVGMMALAAGVAALL